MKQPDYKVCSAMVRRSGQVIYFYFYEMGKVFAQNEGLQIMTIDDTIDPNQKNLGEWVRELAATRVIEVTFTKADGTNRVLLGTLDPNEIPADKAPKGTGKAENPMVVALFDVQAQDWRSFRIDSIQRINRVD